MGSTVALSHSHCAVNTRSARVPGGDRETVSGFWLLRPNTAFSSVGRELGVLAMQMRSNLTSISQALPIPACG
jgi:hypothetical protein